MDMAGPDRRRVSLRQVTTATPAGLDFRANGVADEGCADTMSTESSCSITVGSTRFKPAIRVATRKHLEFWGIPGSGIQRLLRIPVVPSDRTLDLVASYVYRPRMIGRSKLPSPIHHRQGGCSRVRGTFATRPTRACTFLQDCDDPQNILKSYP